MAKTELPTVEVGYNPFLPAGTSAGERLRAENGPRCANPRCKKPKWLAAEAGGCDCPRYSGLDDSRTSLKSLEHRHVEATEGILRVLTAIAASMSVAVPPAPESAPPPPLEPYGPAGLRAG